MQELFAKYVLLLAVALAAPALVAAPASLAAPASPAQALAPDALLRAVSLEVIGKIRQDQELHPDKVAALVETSIMPLFDFVHMTRLAMARNWRVATPEQQRVLTEEFRGMLVRTYSTALGHYRGEAIDFRQLRAAPLATDVTVRSEVRQPGKERMTLDYHMENTAAGWKIYDVKVAGVRLVTTYREVFAEKIRESGVDGLIKSLEEGNHGGASKFNSVKNSFWEKSRVLYAIFQDLFRGGRQ
jgi:phospholipid transport system substrate-binding protein